MNGYSEARAISLLYGTLPGPFTLRICQGLSGISGAVFGVMMTLVAAGLTRGTGRFNLTLGMLGVAIYIGTSLSTAFAGVTVALFGGKAAYLGLALTGLCGLLLLWVGMPETHPSTVAAPKPTSAEKIGATPRQTGLPTQPVLDATEDTKAAHLKDNDEMEDAISRNRCCARTWHRSVGDCRLDRLCGGSRRGGTARQRSAHIRQSPRRWITFGSKTDEHD